METKRIVLVLTLVLVLSMTATAFAASNPFADLPADHWAYDSIIQLAAAGLVEGYPDGTFGGSRMLTRYEAAMVFSRALDRLEAIVEAGLASELDVAQVEAILAENLDELALNERLRKAERRLASLSNAEGDFTSLFAMLDAVNSEVDELGTVVTKLDGTVGLMNPVVIGLNSDVSKLNGSVAGLEGEVTTLYGVVSELEGDVVDLEEAIDALIIDLANVNEAEITNLKALVTDYQGDVADLEKKLNAEVVNLAGVFLNLSNEFAREISQLEKRMDNLEGQYASLDSRVADVEKVQFKGLVKSNYSNLQVFEVDGDTETKIDGPVKGILGYKDDTYETKLGNFSSELQLTIATQVSDSVKVNLFGSVKGTRPANFDNLDKYTVEVLSDTPISRLVLGTVSDKEVKSRFAETVVALQPANGALADVKLGPVETNFVAGVKGNDGLVAAAAKYTVMPELGLKVVAGQLLDENLEAADPTQVGLLVGAFGDVAGVKYEANLALDRYDEDVEDNTLINAKVNTKIGVLGLNAEYALAGENFGTGELAKTPFTNGNALSRLLLGADADLFGVDLAVEHYQERDSDNALINGVMLDAATSFDLGVPVAVSGKFGMMNEPDLRNAISAKVELKDIELADVKLGASYTFASNYIDGSWRDPAKWLDKDVNIVAADLGYGTDWDGADVKLAYNFALTVPFGETAEEFGNQMSHTVKADYGFAKDLKFNVSAKRVNWTAIDAATSTETDYKVNEIKAGFEYKF